MQGAGAAGAKVGSMLGPANAQAKKGRPQGRPSHNAGSSCTPRGRPGWSGRP